MSSRLKGNGTTLEAQMRENKVPSCGHPHPNFLRIAPFARPLCTPMPLLTQAGNQPGQFHFLVPTAPLACPAGKICCLHFFFFPFRTQVHGQSVRALPGKTVIQAEGDGGGREEKKAWGRIIVSEKPHLMAALCLGRGLEGQA